MKTLEGSFLTAWPPSRWQNMTVLLAVSGGPDSVALAHAMAATRPANSRCVLAHFNHALRGDQSDEDEQFSLELAAQLGMQAISNKRSPSNSDDEATLRTERYHFLEVTASRVGARYVLTGHTADDQIETILLQLFRGTGLSGLSGMRSVREIRPGSEIVLARPLLTTRRRDLLEYLDQIRAGFRTDESNLNSRYSRNWLRLELLPLLEARWGNSVGNAILRTASIAAETQLFLEQSGREFMDTCIVPSQESARIPLQEQTAVNWPVVHQALLLLWKSMHWPLQSMTQEHWNQLKTLIYSDDPSERIHSSMFPGDLQCHIRNQYLEIRKQTHPESI